MFSQSCSHPHPLRTHNTWKPPKGGGRTFPTFTRSLFAAQWATDSCRASEAADNGCRQSRALLGGLPSHSAPHSPPFLCPNFCNFAHSRSGSPTRGRGGTVGGGKGSANGNGFSIVVSNEIVIRNNIAMSLMKPII